MNIPWKFKSFIFGVIDFLEAPKLLYFLQRNITKRSRIDELKINPDWEKHKACLLAYNSRGPIFEFGAGKSLAQNLFLSEFIGEQIVVDLNPMLEIDSVELARSQLAKDCKFKSNGRIKQLSDLEEYGIFYKSPYDASDTEFVDGYFDACISTDTLEHIPKSNIEKIFSEVYRILKYDGIVSAKIDYSDHYAHTDKSISLLNFLKFDEQTWQKFNHSCHYQNRLRHNDYLRIFKEAGFSIIAQDLVYDDEAFLGKPKINIDGDETWKATSAHILLKKQ